MERQHLCVGKRNLPGQQTHERGDGAGSRSWKSNRKGEHKSKKELTEGKEGEIKNLREDVQSIAQARKKAEGKKTNG